MKVLNLRCSRLHYFEGWFASENDFQSQLTRGLMECPVCADSEIQKMPSAPRLNFGGQAAGQAAGQAERSGCDPAQPAAGSQVQLDKGEGGGPAAAHEPLNRPGLAEQAAFLVALRQVMAATEDVGRQFVEEARRMHYGEAPARSIRGQASPREALEMQEEGIEVMALPLLPGSAETLQ